MYNFDFTIQLGCTKTGLSATLLATLVNSSDVVYAADIATNAVEFGTSGAYHWHYSSMPNGFRGAIVFHTGAWAGTPTILATVAINPQEVEYCNAPISDLPTAAEVRAEMDANSTKLDAPVSSRAVPGDPMALTAGAQTGLVAAVWGALISGLTTVGSVGAWVVAQLAKLSTAVIHVASNSTTGKLTIRQGYDYSETFTLSGMDLAGATVTLNAPGKERTAHWDSVAVVDSHTVTLTLSDVQTADEPVGTSEYVWCATVGELYYDLGTLTVTTIK